MTQTLLPIARMRDRAALAREESDTAYFFELLYFGRPLRSPRPAAGWAGR